VSRQFSEQGALTSWYSVSFEKDIPELLDRVRNLGLEGLIGKRSGSKYEAGRRTGPWIKIKLYQNQATRSSAVIPAMMTNFQSSILPMTTRSFRI
jgi:ATP-dependent DNA ligase